MNYVALYRKYRPATFDGVVGQDHIVNTLVNQITADKVSHAYLFTGTRGTGKTSVAKIFAKSINCLTPIEGSACGQCSVCKALASNNLDIIEMDAASNSSVDYARDIRDKVQYPPTIGRYKVYIIDEAHMLTTNAFNALLKTIEEPPAHAVFVLCTTETHKLPATIVSRCMRFDFALIPTVRLAQLVADIFDQEGKQYTQDALYLIAQAGEGSARDCLSIADRCYSITNGQLTSQDVMAVLGTSSRQSVLVLAKAILDNDIAHILLEIHTLMEGGKDIARLNRDLLQTMRDLLIVMSCNNANTLLHLPEDIYADIYKLANTTTSSKLLYAIDNLAKLEGDMRYALSPITLFEAVTLRIANNSGDVDYVSLDRRIAKLEQSANADINNATAPIQLDKDNALSVWRAVTNIIKQSNAPLLLATWQDIRCSIEGNSLVVYADKGGYLLINTRYKQILADIVFKVSGRALVVEQRDEPIEQNSMEQLKKLASNIVIN